MDRIERIDVRPPQWARPEIDPDREDIADRRRREGERRRRRQQQEPPPEPRGDDDPPHHIDVRV